MACILSSFAICFSADHAPWRPCQAGSRGEGCIPHSGDDEFRKLSKEAGLPRWHSGQESACQCRKRKKHVLDPWVRKISWRRKWQPTLVFLPGKSYGQRRLVGYSPWGCKESDTTEHAQKKHINREVWKEKFKQVLQRKGERDKKQRLKTK